MVFSSPIFLFLFLPVVFIVYSIAPRRLRNFVLLLASICFYMWGERLFFAFMLASIVFNWLFGLALDAFAERTARKLIVAAAVALNLGLLAFYKYAEFLAVNLNLVLAAVGVQPVAVASPHLPLGISFFTFHALSYVIDVYRRDAGAQKSPIDFALYISFFPQLIAGPIVRYHDIFRQLSKREMTLDLAASGVERFLTGLGKKVLLANPLGEVADQIFVLPIDQINPAVAWLGLICYTLQIYFDFSGYSDMAIGLARLFGFNFLENFNYPYTAQSIQEFWRRWHISLSNWFRDYVYIPLGGNQVPEWRIYLNLWFVFFVCGLWHGASWTFVVWGLIHGAFLVFERMGLASLIGALPPPFRHLYTMLVVMCGWVFFRSADIDQALGYLRVMVGLGVAPLDASVVQYVDPLVGTSLVLSVLACTPVFSRITADWRCRSGQVRGELNPGIETLRIGSEATTVLRIRLVLLLSIGVLAGARIAAGTYNPFIYFRF